MIIRCHHLYFQESPPIVVGHHVSSRWAIPPEGLNCEPGVDWPRRKPWICRRFHNKASWKVSKILRASNHKSWLLLLLFFFFFFFFFQMIFVTTLVLCSPKFPDCFGGKMIQFYLRIFDDPKRKSHESHEASEAQSFRLDFVWNKSNCNGQWCGKTARKMKDPVAQGGMHFLVRVWSFRSMTNFFGPLAIMNCLKLFAAFHRLNKSIATTMIFEHNHGLEFLLSVEPVFLKRRISWVD